MAVLRKRRVLLAFGLSAVLILLGVNGIVRNRLSSAPEPLRGRAQQPAPSLTPDPSDGQISLVEEEILNDNALPKSAITGGPEIELAITAPPGMTEMQVTDDPTFQSADWGPTKATTSLTITNTGYQTVFARFRHSNSPLASTPVVTGVTIDPTFVEATSGAEGSLKKASWVRPLAPNTLLVRIEDGRLQLGSQQPYDFAEPAEGDDVDRSDRLAQVTRNGEEFGRQVSGSKNVLRTYDSQLGARVDIDQLESASWLLKQSQGSAQKPVTVERRSSMLGAGTDAAGEPIRPLVHDVVLRFAANLEPGEDYELSADGDLIEPQTYRHDPTNSISPAIHVNQVGFTPNSKAKVASVSSWFEGGATTDYSEFNKFEVREMGSGAVVYESTVSRRRYDSELGKGDLTGMPVFEMDFSKLTNRGRYRVCLVLVGCSQPFNIAEDVWLGLTSGLARAMYHQRSGISLGAPHTSIERPRPYHPDDGMVVRSTGYSGLDALNEPLDQIFVDVVEQRTETKLSTAWGGHFDAGDWDRRVQHLWYVRSVIELVETYPETFASMDLNIPESGDATPDLIDEALWSLDTYRRMQTDEGGIRGGIEASEHPQPGDSSWTDDLAVFAYAPDPWSSYIYAGVAAQTAATLKNFDAPRAAEYAESALRAMQWAEDQPPHPTKNEEVQSQRAVAAAALLRLTGATRWHDLFIELTSFDSDVEPFLSCHGHDICDAAWLYLATDESQTDDEVRNRIAESFVRSADDIVAGVDSTAFGWALENRNVPLVWGLGPGGNPSAVGLMRAFQLIGAEKYRTAAIRSASVSLGANPRNTVFITGTGSNPVQHPLNVDTRNGGLPVWRGTPVFGPHQLGSLDKSSANESLGNESWVEEFVVGPSGALPGVQDVPYMWQWQDVHSVAMFNEYTVHQSHAGAIYAFGSLAGSFDQA